MLRYAKVSNRLFFTTALQDAVQTYDLEHSALLGSAYEHPKPPNAFAVSSTSHLLLSASESPPVIQLTNLLLGTRPLLLRPQCSSASVVVVEFHPERGNIFMLAFADDTCAVYDAAFIFRDGGTGERRSGASAAEVRWEVAHIKGLHAPSKLNSTTRSSHSTDVIGVDPALDRDQAIGITAAAFIPGHKTTVVTAGSDGKCCLLDFAASEARKANLIRSWHIAGSATSLTLLAPSLQDGTSLPIAGLRDRDTHDPTIYMAVGCRDSKVYIFDLHGNLLWEQTIFQGGSGILDVEWMEGDDWPQPVPSRSARAKPPKSKSSSSRKSPGSVLAGGRVTAEEIVAVLDDVDPDEKSGDIKHVGQSKEVGRHNTAFNHKDLPALMSSLYPANSDHDDSSGKTDTNSSESLGTMMRNFQFPLPPIRNVPQVPLVERRGVGQLPRNNSWAAESPPNNQALQKVLDANSIEAYLDTSRGVGESVLTSSFAKTQPPLKSLPLLTSSEAGPSGGREVTRQHEQTERKYTGVPADRPDTNQEDLWTDITVDEGAPVERHDPGSSDKENNFGKDPSFAPKDEAVGPSITKPLNHHAQPKRTPGGGFTIFVDKKDRKDHPQPLSANPSKAPVSGRRQPLTPASTNTSRLSPAVRAPWYRQKARNGSGENHRSSIYGPGALARKIQQEVMITVSVELDVLRREMNERFAFQKAECEFEIKKSQVWTLRVEDENRKLREELAKERKRREGEKGRERLNLC
ncbi:MAG: hypothetical protein L6R38_007611 [Xanthoria sp. 2 TBL-2021]|nr:MAG: hypothetical protein L6R38_007611 [Xanthoria sp. 2 TBL-2021]